MFNKRYLIIYICATVLLMVGCKKALENISENTFQKYFEENILNRTFIVNLAIDTTIDKTSRYTGYDFVLGKGENYTAGPMTGTKDGIIYTGAWSTDAAYNQLNISITAPSIPSEFIFINRVWRFTKKSLPIMELAPLNSTDPKLLHMRRL